MLKSKIFYVMAIACIALLATIFGVLYPTVSLRSVSTVLAVLGVILAAAAYRLMKKMGVIKQGDK